MLLGSHRVQMPLRPGRRLLVALLGLATAWALPVPTAYAAEPTELSIAGVAKRDGETTTVTLQLTSRGTPLAGQPVEVLRRTGGQWRPHAVLTTDSDGRATTTAVMSRSAADNAFSAAYAGGTVGTTTYDPASAATVVPLVKRPSRLDLSGPRRVVDERSATLRVAWRTADGTPVSGRVVIQRRVDGSWRSFRTLRTDETGVAQLTVRPRSDSTWRARAGGTDWAGPATSAGHALNNVPPGTPVLLPSGAPRPRVKLPRPARAVGDGPNVVVTRIPAGIWSQMTGRSWHRGCPVGRSGLRLVRVNFWGYDGYRYRGEIVAATGAADNMAGALAEMYRRGFPIRAMYRVDRFGWSHRLKGADDYRSMAAGNTSAFNCRWVVGRPGIRSPHSYGRSLDVNTWENPYYSAKGVVPNGYWGRRSHPRVAWRSRQHPVVRIMARHGLGWTYGRGDSQHFDVGGGHGRMGRSAAEMHPQCDGFICK